LKDEIKTGMTLKNYDIDDPICVLDSRLQHQDGGLSR